MYTFGPYTVSQYLPPNPPLQFTVSPGAQFVRISNNSPYQLNLDLGGMSDITFPERLLEDLKVASNFNGIINITPKQNITNVSQATSNELWVNVYYPGELAKPQILQLQPQAVSTNATGKPLYSATVGFGSTTTADQTLNIFNPANSGVVMTFYALRAFTNDTTFPTLDVGTEFPNDLNLGTPVPIASHTGAPNPPISVGHATAADDGIIHAAGSIPEVMDMQSGVTQDSLQWPDEFKLYPGNNATMTLSSGSTGHVVRLTAKWQEDIIVPAIVVQGATAVAGSLSNVGNPPDTSLIFSQDSNGVNAFNLFNSGDGVWGVDASGTLHKVITVSQTGNHLQLVQAGDIAEIVGQLLVDQLLALANPGTVFSGSTSGTLTFYTPIWGTSLKILLAVESNYVSVNTPQFNFPSSANFLIGMVASLGTETFEFFNGVTGLTSRHWLTIGAAGAAGTDEGVTNLHGLNLFNVSGPMTNVIFGAQAAAGNTLMVAIGV